MYAAVRVQQQPGRRREARSLSGPAHCFFFLFFLVPSNWTEENLDVLRLCEVTGSDGNPCDFRALRIAAAACCLCLSPFFILFIYLFSQQAVMCRQGSTQRGRAVFLSSSSSSSWETLTSEKSSPAAQPSWEFPPFYFSLSVRCVESRLLCKQLAPPPSVLSPLARHRQLALYKLITVNCVPPLHNQLMWPTQNSQVCFCACVCVRACDLAGHPLNQSCHGDAALK